MICIRMKIIKKIVAIGEIGLDYHFSKEDKVEQINCFIEQIELANTLKLPILVHTRDASLETYKILKNEKKAEYGVLLHCFNPTDDLVRLVLERGYTVAFGGNITYKRTASFGDYLKKDSFRTNCCRNRCTVSSTCST